MSRMHLRSPHDPAQEAENEKLARQPQAMGERVPVRRGARETGAGDAKGQDRGGNLDSHLDPDDDPDAESPDSGDHRRFLRVCPDGDKTAGTG